MAVKLIDVSKKAGVSTATVSRVLNGSSLVVEKTRDKVMKVVRDLGYEPSHAARMLATNKTETIGAVFPYFGSGFFADLLRGVDDEARRHGYHLITSFSHGIKDTMQQVSSLGYGNRVDALVLLNLDIPTEFIEGLSELEMPVILLDRPASNNRLSSVTIDNVTPTLELTHHLIRDHECSSFIILTGAKDTYDAKERMYASLQAMRENGLSEDQVEFVHADFTEGGSVDAMKRWLSEKDLSAGLPDAIIAQNDTMALGAMDVLKQHGFSVPDDVKLVGFDDITAAHHLGLSSVRVDMFEMGKKAGHAAITQLTQGAGVTKIVHPAKFIPRRSCGCA